MTERDRLSSPAVDEGSSPLDARRAVRSAGRRAAHVARRRKSPEDRLKAERIQLQRRLARLRRECGRETPA